MEVQGRVQKTAGAEPRPSEAVEIFRAGIVDQRVLGPEAGRQKRKLLRLTGIDLLERPPDLTSDLDQLLSTPETNGSRGRRWGGG